MCGALLTARRRATARRRRRRGAGRRARERAWGRRGAQAHAARGAARLHATVTRYSNMRYLRRCAARGASTSGGAAAAAGAAPSHGHVTPDTRSPAHTSASTHCVLPAYITLRSPRSMPDGPQNLNCSGNLGHPAKVCGLHRLVALI